jgi:hypothetical protein
MAMMRIVMSMRTMMSTVMAIALASATMMAQRAESGPASGVNCSGRWMIERTSPNGNVQRVSIELNQFGTRVEGNVGGGGGGGGSTAPINNEIYDGRVDQRTVSFYVWRGADRPVKVFYKGMLSANGDEIAFTVTGGPIFPGGSAGGPTPAQAAPTPQGQPAVAVRPAPGAATAVQVVAKRVR